MVKQESRTVDAVDICVDIVDTLHEMDEMTVTELGEELDYSVSTIHAHLSTLEKRGYVIKSGYTYRPSLRFLQIGERVKAEHIKLYKCGREVTQELAESTGEFGWLVAKEGRKAVTIYKYGNKEAVETGKNPVGGTYPFTTTSAGKAMLAHLPSEEVDEILENELNTLENDVAESELRAELEEIRERGFALHDGEYTPKVRGVATPVVDNGTVRGSLSVTGPKNRITDEAFRSEIPDKLMHLSNIIEINIYSE